MNEKIRTESFSSSSSHNKFSAPASAGSSDAVGELVVDTKTLAMIDVVTVDSRSIEEDFPDGGLRAWLVVCGVSPGVFSLCHLSY